MSTPRYHMRWLTLLLSGLGVAGAVLWWVPRAVSEHLLEVDAYDSAVDWAELISLMVPDLEVGLRSGSLSPWAMEELQRLRSLHDVQRFKLFQPDGRQILNSADMEAAASELPPQDPPTGEPSRHAAEVASHATSHVELHHAEPALPRQGRAAQDDDGAEGGEIYSEAYVPIWRDGRVVGVVEVYVDQRGRAQHIQRAFAAVSATVLGVLLALGGLVYAYWRQRMVGVRETEEQVRYLARHDPLSGALNRSSFNDALRQQVWQQRQGGSNFAVLCINLDHFKRVNDSLGLTAGDEVLRDVGSRLRALVRHGDQVARLGGDEFAILQSGVGGEEDVATLAMRVVEELARPFEVAGTEVKVGGSVGAAIWGVDARSIDQLMHKADLALFRAKSDGRSTFSFYDARLDEQLQLRRDLIRELGVAIEKGELALHFQPLFDADGVTLTGYEALARWPHPKRGLIPPLTFIGLAEDSGLIAPLGRWVLRAACEEAVRWPRPLTVAVNLSAAQFQHGDLAELVRSTLAETGLQPGRLELEVTESLLIGSPEPVVGILRTLAASGVRLAMDDFGTGYSSLAYLWRFPFHKLKIDRAFTQNLETDPKVRVIVKSIISLAHSLEIRVNAEGVETDGQMVALRRLGCDELQGFLLGRPGPTGSLIHQAALPAPDATKRLPQPAAPVADPAPDAPASSAATPATVTSA
jgi:diguanylate cyclase (GGDEF)-like protein